MKAIKTTEVNRTKNYINKQRLFTLFIFFLNFILVFALLGLVTANALLPWLGIQLAIAVMNNFYIILVLLSLAVTSILLFITPSRTGHYKNRISKLSFLLTHLILWIVFIILPYHLIVALALNKLTLLGFEMAAFMAFFFLSHLIKVVLMTVFKKPEDGLCLKSRFISIVTNFLFSNLYQNYQTADTPLRKGFWSAVLAMHLTLMLGTLAMLGFAIATVLTTQSIWITIAIIAPPGLLLLAIGLYSFYRGPNAQIIKYNQLFWKYIEKFAGDNTEIGIILSSKQLYSDSAVNLQGVYINPNNPNNIKKFNYQKADIYNLLIQAQSIPAWLDNALYQIITKEVKANFLPMRLNKKKISDYEYDNSLNEGGENKNSNNPNSLNISIDSTAKILHVFSPPPNSGKNNIATKNKPLTISQLINLKPITDKTNEIDEYNYSISEINNSPSQLINAANNDNKINEDNNGKKNLNIIANSDKNNHNNDQKHETESDNQVKSYNSSDNN